MEIKNISKIKIEYWNQTELKLKSNIGDGIPQRTSLLESYLADIDWTQVKEFEIELYTDKKMKIEFSMSQIEPIGAIGDAGATGATGAIAETGEIGALKANRSIEPSSSIRAGNSILSQMISPFIPTQLLSRLRDWMNSRLKRPG